MENIVNHNEIDTQVWNVRLKVVPRENRPDPNTLAPEVRDLYNRLVEDGYGDFIAASKTGENFFVSGTLNRFSETGVEETSFKAYNFFALKMCEMFSSPHKEGFVKADVMRNGELVIISSPQEMEDRNSLEMEDQNSLSFSL